MFSHCFPRFEIIGKLRPTDYWQMAKKLDTTYKSARYGSCTYALILDKRHPKKDRETFPVAMRYTIDRNHGIVLLLANLRKKILRKYAR